MVDKKKGKLKGIDSLQTPPNVEEVKVKPDQDLTVPSVIIDTAQQIEMTKLNFAEKLGEIPNFDFQKMHQDGLVLIKQLKARFSEERQEDMQKYERFLSEIIIDIGLLAEDLKNLKSNFPTPANNLFEEISKILSEDLLIQVYQNWYKQLAMMVEMLQKFEREGIAMICRADQNKFEIKQELVEQILNLFNAMIKTYDDSLGKILRNSLTDEQKNDLDKLKAKLYENKNLSVSEKTNEEVNFEDIIDTEIDEILFGKILEDMKLGKVSAKEMAKQSILAIHAQMHHLRNSLAAQKSASLSIFLEDLQTGLADEDTDYYSKLSPNQLFSSELLAVVSQLTLLDRALKGIIGSQKLAGLISHN